MFDHEYTDEMFPRGNLYREGVRNNKTGKKYPTALSAMLECEQFNDLEIYTEFTTTKEVSRSTLEELYTQRAKKLRAEHDYLELSWGGGHDSTMILKAFDMSGCSLDAISMQCLGDPRHNSSGFNSEIANNLHHVMDYKQRHPKTQVHFLDIDEAYRHTIDSAHDYKKWCYLTTIPMLDDICRIVSDIQVPDRKNKKNGALITGQGYKNAIYNKPLDTWSLYMVEHEVNQMGSVSFHIPTIRFYETDEIMLKVGDDIRQWYNSNTDADRKKTNIMNDDLWSANVEWVHDEIMYKSLKGKIYHDGKDPNYILKWQDEPRFEWFARDPSATKKYKEYFDWIDFLNSNIHPSCMIGKGGILGDGLRTIRACVIDF